MPAPDGNGGERGIEALEQQLAALAVPSGDAAEVLQRLAGVVLAGEAGRRAWPEPGQQWGAPDTAPAVVEPADTADGLHPDVRFRALVEQLPAVVFYAALGDDDNEVYVSPQIESLLGFTQHEWLTNPLLWYSQLHPDDHEAVIAAFTRGVQTGEPFRAEVRFFTRTGSVVWILAEARLIRDKAGRPSYFQGVAFDITPSKTAQEVMAQAERAKIEAAQLRADAFAASNVELTKLNEELRVARDQAEAAARARSTFLTTMSHELRTPLNSVIVLAGLLVDSELSPEQQDMVRRMQLASDHLLELIDDVLEFSRLRAGQVRLDRRSFDLVTWIEDALDIVAPRAAEKGIELRYRLLGDVPRMLMSDEGRLRQVLLNLLGNAVKFTQSGHVEVRTSARRIRPGRWEFRCSVEDTGFGVRPEVAATLFEEFRQADSGIAREYGGTGLGLAICKQLCEILGGQIWAESNDPPGGLPPGPRTGPGPGATFTFTWLADADDASVGPEVAVSVATGTDGRAGGNGNGAGSAERVRRPSALGRLWDRSRRPGRGRAPVERSEVARPRATAGRAPSSLRILLVEDDEMNQEVSRLLLDSMGFQADVASGGEQAVEAIRIRPYDAVLMDVAMPGVDGLSATRAIRALGDAVHQPFIVALTANALPGDAEACLAAGMDDYVAKPIQRDELDRALAAAVGGRLVGHRAAPVLAAPTPRPALDRSVPERILDDFGAEPLRRLFAIFRAKAPQLAAALVDGVARGDLESAGLAAHTLKSSASNVGADHLAALCGQIEELARGGSLDGAEPLAAAVPPALSAALEALTVLESTLLAG